MKIKILLLSALLGAGASFLLAPSASAATPSASALGQAAKASPMVQEVVCRWRRICKPGWGCRSRRVCW
jgi:hypothetical protein